MKNKILIVLLSTIFLSSATSQTMNASAPVPNGLAKAVFGLGASAICLTTGKWLWDRYIHHGERIKHYATEIRKLNNTIETLEYINENAEPGNDITHIWPRTIENLMITDQERDSLYYDLAKARIEDPRRERTDLKNTTEDIIDEVSVRKRESQSFINNHRFSQILSLVQSSLMFGAAFGILSRTGKYLNAPEILGSWF